MQSMSSAITEFKKTGLLDANRGDGFVLGILKTSPGGDLEVDTVRNAELVKLASPFKCVFHRAFDDVLGHAGRTGSVKPWEIALKDVIDCGFDGILTSGGPGNAPQNAAVLRALAEAAKGSIEIIVGGGVRSSNVRDLRLSTGIEHDGWFHSSCLTTSTMSTEMVDELEVQGILRQMHSVTP
jgi:copper homeostasis protein